MGKRLFSAFFAATLAAAAVYGQNHILSDFSVITTPNPESIRSLSFGGPHVGASDGLYTLFTNPAMLNDAQDRRYFEVSPSFFGNLDEVPDVLAGIFDNTKFTSGSALKAAAANSDGRPVGIDLLGPLALGGVSKGKGGGFFSHIYTDSHVNYGTMATNLNVDVVAAAGKAFSFSHNADSALDFGVTVKGFLRKVTTLDIKTVGVQKHKYLLRDMAPKWVFGGGLDIGLAFTMQDAITISATVNDAPTVGYMIPDTPGTTTGGIAMTNALASLDPNISVGFAVRGLESTVFTWVIALDIRDIMAAMFEISDYGFQPMPLLGHLSLGIEMSFFSIVSIRLGVEDAMPSAGLGVDFGVFEINLAGGLKNSGANPWDSFVPAGGLGLLFRF